MEDYEYLVLLRKAVEKHAQTPEKKELVEKAKKLLSMKDILRYLDDYALEEESFQLFRREAGQLLQELQ